MRVHLTTDHARRRAQEAVRDAHDGWVVDIHQEKRTDRQNRLLWPLLRDWSRQIVWAGKLRSEEDWKNILVSGLRRCEVVKGLNGEPVPMGLSTSGMSKAEFSDLIEYLYAEGLEQGVVFSDPALQAYAEYQEAA